MNQTLTNNWWIKLYNNTNIFFNCSSFFFGRTIYCSFYDSNLYKSLAAQTNFSSLLQKKKKNFLVSLWHKQKTLSVSPLSSSSTEMDYEVSRICEIVEDSEQIDLLPGFRFHPTDEELISHYLKPKVLNTLFSAIAIGEVDLNKVEPWDLPCKLKSYFL